MTRPIDAQARAVLDVLVTRCPPDATLTTTTVRDFLAPAARGRRPVRTALRILERRGYARREAHPDGARGWAPTAAGRRYAQRPA